MVSRSPEPRVRIRESALALFARYGVAGTKLSDIARRAGLSKATLYHHFPSGKESIFQVAVDALVNRHWESTEGRVAEVADPLEGLLLYVNLRLDEFDRGLATWGVDREVWKDLKPWVEPTLEKYFQKERTLLVGRMRECVEAGLMRDCDVDIVAGFVHGILRTMTLEGPIESKARDRKVESAEFQRFIAGGLLTSKGINHMEKLTSTK